MTNLVQFPALGLSFTLNRVAFSIGGINIYWYGVCIAVGMCLALVFAFRHGVEFGVDADAMVDVILIGVVMGILCARLYYVIFSWDMYKDDIKSIINIREGGLAIYGGVITAIIVVFIFAKIKKLSPFLLFDTGGFGLITGQMIGRWGNFFNREAFGEYTNGLFAMRLPVDAVRSSDITTKMWNHAETVKGVMYIQVHPTYLYESMWCLMVLIIMLLYRKHKKFDGEVFLIYLLGYGLGRFWIESLRTDQLLLPKVGLPVSQLLAGTIVIVSAILVITGRKKAARIKSTVSNHYDRYKKAGILSFERLLFYTKVYNRTCRW